MQMIDYRASDFEMSALNAVQSNVEFVVRITGWRRKFIASGLSHYRSYRQAHHRAVHALMLIPYVFITPTFWVVCVKAEFENFMPSWQIEKNELLVSFAKPA